MLKTSNCRQQEKIPPVRSECRTMRDHHRLDTIRRGGRKTQTAECPTATRQEKARTSLRRASSTAQKVGLSPMEARSAAPRTLRPRISPQRPGGNPCSSSKGTTPTPSQEQKFQPRTMPQQCGDPSNKTRLNSICRSVKRALHLQSSHLAARSSSMLPSLIVAQT